MNDDLQAAPSEPQEEPSINEVFAASRKYGEPIGLADGAWFKCACAKCMLYFQVYLRSGDREPMLCNQCMNPKAASEPQALLSDAICPEGLRVEIFRAGKWTKAFSLGRLSVDGNPCFMVYGKDDAPGVHGGRVIAVPDSQWRRIE